MPSEGPRVTLYIGYQGRSVEATGGAPVLAHDPAGDTGGKAGGEWIRAFDEEGNFNLKPLSRKRRLGQYDWAPQEESDDSEIYESEEPVPAPPARRARG